MSKHALNREMVLIIISSQSLLYAQRQNQKINAMQQRLFYSPLLWGEVRGFGGRAPKARAESRRRRRRGDGVWGRGVALPTGGRACMERGSAPSPEKFISIFGLQIATFGALWGLFLLFSGLFWTLQPLHDIIMSVTVSVTMVSLQVPELSMHWRTTVKEWAARIITSCADMVGPALFTIAGLFHFRCDASLITEYRPYAATPGVELWLWSHVQHYCTHRTACYIIG